LATEVSGTFGNIRYASGTTVNTREHLAVNAFVVASSKGRDRSLATIASITVAVGKAIIADEDTVSTGLEVSDITVTVGNEGSAVDVGGKSVALLCRCASGLAGITELIADIESNAVAEIVPGFGA